MSVEYEIKILNINPKSIRQILIKNGFMLESKLKYQRYIFDTADSSAWIRLRTDGKITTLAYKNAHKDAIDGVEEIEVEVNNFQKTKELIEAAGHRYRLYQENRRELYKYKSIEVSIDEWPHIPPYLEIEAKDKKTVISTLHKLGLSDNKTTSLPTEEIYKIYKIDINNYPILTFET